MKPVRDSSGAAVVETILLILVLFVPLVALVGALGGVHRAGLAVTAAAREAGSAAVSAGDPPSAVSRANDAVQTALRDHKLDPQDARVELRTLNLERGARVEVKVGYPVRVFDVPFAADGVGPAVWVRASHAAYVDPYRSFP